MQRLLLKSVAQQMPTNVSDLERFIYSFVPDEPQKHLFNIVGMSVGRFIDNQDGSWYLTSRDYLIILIQ
jgi:hypothetical protein